MTFNSLQYAAFLPVVVMLAWSTRSARSQNALLLVASYAFYGAWDWRFLGLILLSTAVDHTVAGRLGRTVAEGRRRLLLMVSLVTNLGILGIFKYAGFFTDSFERLLDKVGFAANLPVLEVALPVGISFYTFQTIAYTFDVYRRRVEPEDDLVTFALYVSFFPQLVAGPIERAGNLLPRLRQHRPRPGRDEIVSGVGLILFGLVKKVVIADAVAPVVARAFNGTGSAGWPTLLLGTYAFALQIYGDFSGYTDVARGSARLLGVELMHNFRQPYLSRSVTEFWQRWHISLSTWLRDYLYVPLGGNRSGKIRTYRNLMIVMLLGGLWHGAAWTFVAWGFGHGAWLAMERLLKDVRGERPARTPAVIRWFVTFHGAALLFVIFRSGTLRSAATAIKRLLTFRSGRMPSAEDVALVAVALVAVFAVDLLQRHRSAWLSPQRWRPVQLGAAAGVAIVLIAMWSGGTPTPFIYFQF